MSRRRNERWSEQDVALVEAKRQLTQAVKTPPIDATTARSYSFTVPGVARPGGSKQAFVPLNKKKLCHCGPKPTYVPFRRPNGSILANVVDANKNVGKWKKWVARIAREEYSGPLFDGFLRVTFIFYQPRPQDHYTSTGKLSKHGLETPWPNVKPDTTKLVRAAEDALLNIVYTDDAIIVKQRAEKEYGIPPRVEILIEELALPEQHDQADLFGALEPPAPWETAESAASHPQRHVGIQAQEDGAAKTPGTSDDGTSHNGQNQTQAIAGPPPWEQQNPVEDQKEVKRTSRKGSNVKQPK